MSKRKLHDNYFKKYLSDLSEVEAFIRMYFPPEVVAICDFKSLILVPTEMISQGLVSQHTDLVLAVKHLHTQQYMYFLIEHQSTIDKFMAARFLRYIIAIGAYHQAKFKSKKYPDIYVFHVYNGKARLTQRLCFFDLFNNPEPMRQQILDGISTLDLNAKPNALIVKNKSLSYFEFSLKNVGKPDILELMSTYGPALSNSHIPDHLVEPTVHYLVSGSQHNPEVLIDALVKFFPPDKEAIVLSTADLLVAKGRAEGLKLGIEQGIEKGRQESIFEMAHKLLAENANLNTIAKVTGLSLEQLRALTPPKAHCLKTI